MSFYSVVTHVSCTQKLQRFSFSSCSELYTSCFTGVSGKDDLRRRLWRYGHMMVYRVIVIVLFGVLNYFGTVSRNLLL